MSFSLVSGGQKNLWIGRFSIFPDDMFIHGISTRYGGESTDRFEALNLGLHVGDDRDTVCHNRDVFFDGLGLVRGSGVTCQQVHGCDIMVVNRDDIGRGMYAYDESIPNIDALITDTPELPLMLFFADCTPVLLADPVRRAIGVAHAGWKGTAAGIGMKTVQRMVREYGCKPENILASIGPAIGPCCYEVGEQVLTSFDKTFPQYKTKIFASVGDDKYRLNLWEANRLQLLDAGLVQDNIDVAGVCTACNHKQFFSYRAEGGTTGRIAAVLAIK
ncbi:MAG: peptidoglycan editing factor PgeF [Anaerovibrio sp.]|uniref:peptidoglycan editing factor PgeF n=1 Tax=Anaerovibrio sp. TaxID=1872532 RepID=UPI0025F0B733|nr:peptidoglycan editing factor PgeF [Anaerovibrio sp.]MCR5175971.1 peptidoglycan editing factor PgeF [Anaerovibrio sp.]